MLNASVKEHYIRLCALRKRHNYQYHTLDAPSITDEEFDALTLRIQSLEKAHPELCTLIAPEERSEPGGPLRDAFSKVAHLTPMLSLDNAFNESDLKAFMTKIQRFLNMDERACIPLFGELKIDGLSASLMYEDGVLTQCVTRGNGHEGEDVTHTLSTLQDIPKFLQVQHIAADKMPDPSIAPREGTKSHQAYTAENQDLPGRIEVRGEVYMTRADFEALNAEQKRLGKPLFANPRNAAAGSVRQLDANIARQRPLRFFAYNALAYKKHAPLQKVDQNNLEMWREDTSFFKTQQDVHAFLTHHGFFATPHASLLSNITEVMAFYQRIADMRAALSFDIDGCVYKVNDCVLQQRLGAVGKAPRFAIAHKFLAEKALATLERIEFQVGRTGAVTPVAHLSPTLVGGVVVSRATLHNFDEIKRKDVREKDRVWVQRAGDVIPQILGVVLKERDANTAPTSFPTHCPSCDTPLKTHGAFFFCSNHHGCADQILARLCHFVSKDAMNIDGLGERHLKNFLKKGTIKNAADIFTLKERDQHSLTPLRTQEGFGPLSAKNLFASIESSKSVSLARFIYSLGIDHVGKGVSALLSKHFVSAKGFLKGLKEIEMHAHKNALLHIDGIGPSVVEALHTWGQDAHFYNVTCHLVDVLDIQDDVPVQADQTALSGKTLVFTGSLEMSRAEAKEKSIKAGAKVSSSLSSKTDFLIAGENSGSKLKKAASLGVKVLSEQEWHGLCHSVLA